ncbi:MAG TPA: DUF805 domain-containing protein [Pseudolabrys sp.]|nr:DUF805 domain-containing protein [Pseudolabrys sp.]
MNFGEAIKSGFSNYVNFSGRAPRSEYWFWTLFAVIISIVANIIDSLTGTIGIAGSVGIVGLVISLALLLPGIAVSVRRLHDLDRTGWWLLIILTGIGAIVLLIWDCIKGTSGPNRFGADPLGA